MCLLLVHDHRFALLAFALVGCFGDPPSGGSGPATDTAATEDASSNVDGTDPSSATSDPDTSVGSMDASGEESSTGEPCDPVDPECTGPGETIWNVELGDDGNDGTYSLVVEGDEVIVGGELTSGASSRPWMFSLALDSGAERWSNTSAAGEGTSVVRGVTAIGNGRVAGVGTLEYLGTSAHSWFEVRGAGGESITGHPYDGLTLNYLLGATKTDAGIFAVGFSSESDVGPYFPALLQYHAYDPWTLDLTSFETGAFDGYEGSLFDIAVAPNGSLVAVGYAVGTGQDSVVYLLSPGGDSLAQALTIDSPFDDGLTSVAIADDGSAVAAGRDGTGEFTSDLLIFHFQVGDTITPGVEITWGVDAYTLVNGFARDGDTLFLAAGTSNDPMLAGPGFDSAIIRWDGEAAEPTWVQRYADDPAGRDYAADVALAPDGTIVACGVMTPLGSTEGNAWVRRMGR